MPRLRSAINGSEFEYLVGQGPIGLGSRGPRIVLGDRDAVARGLGHPDAARDHRLEDPRRQVLPELPLDILREAGAVVGPRGPGAGALPLRVLFTAEPPPRGEGRGR